MAAALGGSLLRCDKLEQSEVKSLLMCFLHVLKSMSEGKVACEHREICASNCMPITQKNILLQILIELIHKNTSL